MLSKINGDNVVHVFTGVVAKNHCALGTSMKNNSGSSIKEEEDSAKMVVSPLE